MVSWSPGRAGGLVLPGDGGPLGTTSTEQYQARLGSLQGRKGHHLRGRRRYELWPVLALGGLAQHQAVADERIEGSVSCISAEAAVRVTARQITEAIQRGQVVYWQVVAAFLYTSACLSKRSAPANPTLVVLSQRRRASARLILPSR